jgi:hypothetical protein
MTFGGGKQDNIVVLWGDEPTDLATVSEWVSESVKYWMTERLRHPLVTVLHAPYCTLYSLHCPYCTAFNVLHSTVYTML